MPAHINIFLVVSLCFFVFFLGYIPFVSTLAPHRGQQLFHLQCSLPPHGCTQPAQRLAGPCQPQPRSTQPHASPPHPKTVPTLFQQPGWDAKLQGRDREEPRCLCCCVSGVGQAGGSWWEQRPRGGASPCRAVPWEGRGSGAGLCPTHLPQGNLKTHQMLVAGFRGGFLPDFKVARLYLFCLHLELGRKHPPSYYKAGPTEPPFTS